MLNQRSIQDFSLKQLEKLFQIRVSGYGRPGCGGCEDPGLHETETGMWNCLSALLGKHLCPVSAFDPVEYVFLTQKTIMPVNDQFNSYKHKCHIINNIDKTTSKKHDSRMMVA